MVVKNCRECEHTNNCRSYYSGLGCKKRDEILKHVAELEAEKKEGKANDQNRIGFNWSCCICGAIRLCRGWQKCRQCDA